MSRRRFFNPSTTYQSFIHNIEEYKQHSAASKQRDNDATASALAVPPSQASSRPLSPYRHTGANTGSSNHSGQSVDIWLSRRNLDAVVKRKSLLIFLNGMFGIALMIAILQVGWDGTVYHDTDPPGSLPILLSLKIACSLSSALLVYQLLDRKRLQVSIKYRDKRRKVRTVKPVLTTVSLSSLLSLRPSVFRPKLWAQMIVCAFHPFPFTALVGLHLSNKWGLLMLLRLHLIFRVLRDHSEIWLNRRSIKRLTAFSSRTPNFDWWLSVKTMLYRRPIAFASSFYFICILVFGWIIYIFEREVQPELMTLAIGWFLAYQCITIDWAADVYDVYNPVTWSGKLTCLVAAMMGLLLTSFIIGIVSQSVLPSKFEETALNCISVEQAREHEKENAAKLIQFVWRNHRHEKELAEKLATKNPRLYEEIAAVEEKEFMEEFLARSKLLRNTRRQRAELEEQLVQMEQLSLQQQHQHKASVLAHNEEFELRVLAELKRVHSQQEEIFDWIRNFTEKAAKRRRRKRDREANGEEEGDAVSVSVSETQSRRRSKRRSDVVTSSGGAGGDYDTTPAINPNVASLALTHEPLTISDERRESQPNDSEVSDRESAQPQAQAHRPLLGRQRRVRSLSPHSAALAAMAISAMTGTGGRRRTIVGSQQPNRRASISGPLPTPNTATHHTVTFRDV